MVESPSIVINENSLYSRLFTTPLKTDSPF